MASKVTYEDVVGAIRAFEVQGIAWTVDLLAAHLRRRRADVAAHVREYRRWCSADATRQPQPTAQDPEECAAPTLAPEAETPPTPAGPADDGSGITGEAISRDAEDGDPPTDADQARLAALDAQLAAVQARLATLEGQLAALRAEMDTRLPPPVGTYRIDRELPLRSAMYTPTGWISGHDLCAIGNERAKIRLPITYKAIAHHLGLDEDVLIAFVQAYKEAHIATGRT